MGALPFNPTYGASIGAPTRCPMTSWPPCARWAQGRTFRLIETQGTPGAVEGKLSQGGEFRVRIALGGPCTGRVEACEPPAPAFDDAPSPILNPASRRRR